MKRGPEIVEIEGSPFCSRCWCNTRIINDHLNCAPRERPRFMTRAERAASVKRMMEAKSNKAAAESNKDAESLPNVSNIEPESNSQSNKAFDKKAYQREYMRKRRSK